MAPSNLGSQTPGSGNTEVKRKRRKVRVINPNQSQGGHLNPTSASTPRSFRAPNTTAFNRLYAKTRAGVFVRAGIICVCGFSLLFIDPIFSSLLVCILAMALLRPAIAMVILLPLSPVLTSANPAIFGNIESPLVIQAPLLGLSWAILIYIVLRKRLRPGRTSFVFMGCVAIGGLLSLLTTTSFDTTFDALWKFAIPLFPMIFWFDNRKRSVCSAKEAPYALAGIMAAIILGSFILLPTGAGSELNTTDFQGIFWHPQTMGMMMAAAAPCILFARRLPLGLRVLLLIGIATLAWLSWTRTALAALTIAGAFAVFIWVLDRLKIKVANALKRPIQISQSVVLCLIAIGSLVYASNLEPQKYSGGTAQEIMTEESYASARTFALYRAYQNFADKPLTGIGFGVPSDPRLLDKEFEARTLEAFRSGGGSEVLFDKGNSYLAIFEENGLLGAPIWLGLFVFLIVSASTARFGASIASIILALSVLAEATAFSLGGVGMVLWASVFLCAGFDITQSRRAQSRASKNTRVELQKKRIDRQRHLHARGFDPSGLNSTSSGVSHNEVD